jgi:hypothetical protein
MSQQIFAKTIDLLKEIQQKDKSKSGICLLEKMSPQENILLQEGLMEQYSKIQILKQRMNSNSLVITENEFQSYWNVFLKTASICLDFEQDYQNNNLTIINDIKRNKFGSNPVYSKKALFFQITKFYHQNEGILFDPSSEIGVCGLLKTFSKEIKNNMYGISNLTSEEILDWVFVSDSFLILLTRLMFSLENSFDFDIQKIKYNFTQQFEKQNVNSGIASRSKSKFMDFEKENETKRDDDFIGRKIILLI